MQRKKTLTKKQIIKCNNEIDKLEKRMQKVKTKLPPDKTGPVCKDIMRLRYRLDQAAWQQGININDL